MKVLHYALGFPPYRSGGLTKFCIDLMTQQAREGHTVAMLWPGQMGFVDRKTAIKYRGEVLLRNQNVLSFEIVNPLPVSFDEGIIDFSEFTSDTDKRPYDKLLEEFNPDVIHVHTLMGLHKSFLLASKSRGIKIVFSAHDFFPICPKVTMFRHGGICNNAQTCEDCGVCNITALSINKIRLLQSPLYRRMKDSKWVKKLRKQHRNYYLSESASSEYGKFLGTKEDYKKLRNYYGSLLHLMDIIHYNSSVTKRVYDSFFDLPINEIVSITHADISDHCSPKIFSDNLLRIRYLGPMGMAKGFFLLKEALDELWNTKQNFCLDVHFTPTEISPYIKIHERYSYRDLESIFSETDIMVCPSILYESFGYTVIEALSYGVPVIISDTVGAQDVLVDGAGIVIHDITSEKLFTIFKNLTAKDLKEMNEAIVEKQYIMQIDDMAEQLEKTCYGWK